ncbi:MAG: GAF domain-containing protein [Glaciimonas sp.]|nr:GAF domain-containing protein [Glaciimonas sp.]
MTINEIRFGQVDLTTCDREPIHIPGAIQPHGVLLVVDRHNLTILQYAGNTRLLLGVEPSCLLQCVLPDLFEQPMLASLVDQLRASTTSAEPMILLDLTTRSGQLALTATFHFQGELAIIELEPARSSRTVSGDPLTQVKAMLAALQSAKDVEACCRTAAAQVRAAIGFSRVMVYQFLHDGSGKVIVEDKADKLDSFLHMHYPASDIPQQAQAMYRRSWLRLIPDTNYTPAPLEPPVIGSNGLPLDMSSCALRSVSPLHLGYLRNMGVGASMSLSIMIGDELWGLIACHNEAPRHMAADLRLACELFAQLFSLQLDARIEKAAAQRRLTHQQTQAALAISLPLAPDIATELVAGKVTLLDLIPAGGAAVWLGGKLHTVGRTPPADAIHALVAWLKGLALPVVDTFQLGTVFAPAIPWVDTACGLLAISLSRHPEDYVLWFRPEVVRTVTWAGDPRKPVESGPHGQRLMPRLSFAAWEADVRHQAAPWDVVEIETAHVFRLWLLEAVLRQMADLAREERETAFKRQSMLMSELDHRVKNTLANIQALVRQTKTQASSLEDFALGLEMRIRAMARAHDLLGETSRKGASVRRLVGDELAPFQTGKNGNSRISGDDVLLSSKAAMPFTMVMHELISNAAKYGALSTSTGNIDISWSRAAGSGALVLIWKERNGPQVEPPTRRGFGSVVIERSLRHELKGSGTLSFDADGVGCVISIPAEYIVPDETQEAIHV